MLKLQVQVFVNTDHYKNIGNASSSVDFSETRIDTLGYYASSLATILGDTLAEEVRKALSLEEVEGDGDGE